MAPSVVSTGRDLEAGWSSAGPVVSVSLSSTAGAGSVTLRKASSARALAVLLVRSVIRPHKRNSRRLCSGYDLFGCCSVEPGAGRVYSKAEYKAQIEAWAEFVLNHRLLYLP